MERDLLKTSMKEYERMAGILGKSVKDAEKHAHELVNTSFRNAHFSDRVWYSEWSLKVELERLLRIGLIQGRNPNVLMRDVEKALKVSKYEARRVMVTEMCRVQTGAQKQTYERNGYDQYTFIVEHDDRLCDDCRDLDGQIFYVKDMAPGHNAPPIHPFCVLPGTKIIAPDMEAITRSWYSGLVVEMTLTNGRRLAVTPNHIMLTSRGWVRAKFIRKGDNVFRYCGGVEPNAVESPTNDNGVPAIEKVFATLAKSSASATRRVPSAPVYLKGDVVPDTEIDVIFTDGELWDKLDTKTRELVSKVGFIGAFELGEIPLNVLSLPAKTLVTMGLAADGIVSGLRELLILRGSPLTHHELVRLRLPSDYDARLIKAASDDGAGNTKGFSECIDALPGEISINNRINVKGLSGVDWDALSDAILSEKTADDTGIMMGDGRNFCDAFPGLVQLDNIVDVSLSEYSGHVYDASSLSTLYIANGVITSNCRCSTSAYADRARLDALIAQIEAERKGDGYKPVKNLDEAQERLADILGKAHENRRERFSPGLSKFTPQEAKEAFMQNANFGNKMDVEMANGILKALTGLVKDYTTTLSEVRPMTGLEYMSNSNSFAGVYHTYSTNESTLMLNLSKLNHHDKHIDRVRELSDDGFLANVPNGREAEYMATHEFAHTLIGMTDKLSNKRNFVGTDYGMIKSARREIDKVYTNYLNALEPIESARSKAELESLEAYSKGDMDAAMKADEAYAKADESYRKICISEYSKENADEFLAESFTQCRMNNKDDCSEYAKKAMSVLDKYFKR
jgi:SPP1 gp7 family putative phage head morphogenesis protein